MKKLDFMLQTVGFTLVGILMLFAIFVEDGIGLLYLGLFYLGLYHICHYFLYLVYTFAKHLHGKEHMAWYPLLVIAYALLARITLNFHNTDGFALLMAALALTIGGYYFHAVHIKTFDYDIKDNV